MDSLGVVGLGFVRLSGSRRCGVAAFACGALLCRFNDRSLRFDGRAKGSGLNHDPTADRRRSDGHGRHPAATLGCLILLLLDQFGQLTVFEHLPQRAQGKTQNRNS